MNAQLVNTDVGEQSLFVGVPGRAGYVTHPTVRAALYRIATFEFVNRDWTTKETVRQRWSKLPSSRLMKYLRVASAEHVGREKCGWAIVASHKHTPVPRVYVMPLGMTAGEARLAFHRQADRIGSFLRYLGLPTDTTRRLLLEPERIEVELGVDNCRAMWRSVRRSEAESREDTKRSRSSMGQAIVALHPEIMEWIGPCATPAEALAAVQAQLRGVMKTKGRDIVGYLDYAWPVAREQYLFMEERNRTRAAQPNRPMTMLRAVG